MNTSQLLKKYIEYCHARGLSPRTIQWYLSILHHFARSNPRLPIGPEPCELFIKSCKAGDERRHGYYRTLKAFYNFINRRLSLPNAMKLVEAPKRKIKLPRPIMPDDLSQLLLFPHPPRIKGALYFLADTGVRVGELVGIQPCDFFDTPWGYMVNVTGKTGQRAVPCSYEAYSALIDNIPFNITANRLSRLLAAAFRDAHVPGTAHCLRHTFGTFWKDKDISILQKIMGHSSITTTMKYRMVQYQQLAEAHRGNSPLKMVLSQSKCFDIMNQVP